MNNYWPIISIVVNIVVIYFFIRKFLQYRKSKEETLRFTAFGSLLAAILASLGTIIVLLYILGYVK